MILEYKGTNLINDGILYFYSSWINDCSISKNSLNEINSKFKNINIQKINVTKYYKLKKDYNIKIIPSFLYIKNDKVISKIDGMSNTISLNKWIVDNNKGI